MSKIIQIATREAALYALDDLGKMWEWDIYLGKGWVEIPHTGLNTHTGLNKSHTGSEDTFVQLDPKLNQEITNE